MTNKIVERARQNTTLIVLIVIVVALLVGNIVLYLNWSSAKAEQSDLEREKSTAQVNLNIANDNFNVEKLQAQLDELSGSPFPTSVSPVQLSLYLADRAQALKVDLVTITLIPAATENIAGKPYTRYGVSVVATGTLPKVSPFLTSLEEGPFDTLRIEGVSYTQSDNTVKFNIVILYGT
jgi:hypothetical protein